MTKVTNILIVLIIVTWVTMLIDKVYPRYNYQQKFNNMSVQEQLNQLNCLTENIYYEASNQNLEGKIAVAQVTVNRVGKFADSICRVVHQRNQFSWTSNKPKSLIHINKQVYEDSKIVAKMVLWEGETVECVGDSTYYHAEYVNPPWAHKFKKTCKIGTHIFYRN